MTARPGAWALVAAWALLIFLASSRPTVPVSLDSGLDKLAHFAVYAVLGALLARALPGWPLSVALGWLYGLSDELHQSFVPGRSAEAADWVADALGVLVGIFVLHQARRLREQANARAAESPHRKSLV